ncbi:hypothetical protein AO498_03945 [Algoriphagus sanaruensis]|uniref:Uncharacterized protein n=1 Tax=Algoriphagus sanaruensis TaxID=1727163 RepID=A0A142EK87_9BACT|nr:hypothetical protein AO498_03945 [Algoriphagus sanaruensis]
MQCGSAKKFSEVGYGGIIDLVQFSYPLKSLITFSISIETTHLWESNYSQYQDEIFTKIRGLKEHILTPLGYRLIAKKLNDEGYLTPENHRFTNTHVFSIYQKGLKRLERVNRIDFVEFSDFEVRPYKSFKKFFKDFQSLKGEKVRYFSFYKNLKFF